MQVLNKIYKPQSFNFIPQESFLENGNSNRNYKEINLNNHPNAIYNINFSGIKSKNIPTIYERFEGCLLGGAIGDAFGAPVEFLKLEQIKEKYGEDGLTKLSLNKYNKAEITDDTQMTLFTAVGLLKSAIVQKDWHYKKQPDYQILFNSYKDWHACQMGCKNQNDWLSSFKIMNKRQAPGFTCLKATSKDIFGTVDKPLNNSKSNGCVMRSAPIGLIYHKNPELAFDIGVNSAVLTHGNPDAYLASGFFASCIAHLLNNKSLNESIESSLCTLKKYKQNDNLKNKIEKAVSFVNDCRDSSWAIRDLGKSSDGDSAIAISLYCALKNPNNYEHAIEMATNFDGDSDTIASITGNIIGAKLGEQGIPSMWKRQIELSDEISIISSDLFFGPKEIDTKVDKRYSI